MSSKIYTKLDAITLFRAGVYWRQLEEREKARIMFLKALHLEQNNYFSLCNLVILDVEVKDYERAIERLQQAVSIAKKKLPLSKILYGIKPIIN